MFMIVVNVLNLELKSLVEKGKSSVYRKLESKKTFLNALSAFFVVLEILNNTKDLLMYQQYHYNKDVEISWVLIMASRMKATLFFKELEEGRRIDIIGLKY